MRPTRRLCPWIVTVALLAGGSLPASPARAQVDGSPDPSFSGDGILISGTGPFSQYTARALAVMPNQEVVVVGDLTSTAGIDHLRVSLNGNVIAECEAGILLLAEFEGLAALVDRAGRLVVAGRSTFSGAPDQDRGLIGRFTSANPCAFDSGWSDNGWQVLDGASFCDTEECAVVDLAESPTAGARLYALLASRVNSLVARLFVVGFRANGDVDTSFGAGGYAEVAATDLGALSSTAAQLVVDGRGRPLVFATRYDPDIALDADPFLIRFTDGGDLDTTFGDDGVEIVDDISGIDSFPAGVVLGSDGTVVYAINLDSGNGVGRASVARPDGSPPLNTLFGNRRIAGVAVQGDGKPLVLLDDLVDDGMEIARLAIDASGVLDLDPTFGNAGTYALDLDFGGADWEQPTAIVLSTGRPWLVGRAASDAAAGMFAMRLRNRFIFADGFEIGTTSFWRR